MKKTTGMSIATLLTLTFISIAPFALAQQQSTRFPNLPPSVVGPELVAWSELQKPQPMPQPLPPPERADHSQADHSQDQSAQPSAQVLPLTQAFVGLIAKDGGRYVLKVSESLVYQIDDQEKAKVFDGKQVRISGRLDSGSNLLHITSIEVAS